MIWLYFISGVRVSEGLGLIWENFSPTKSILHVEATLERDENGKFYRKIDSKKSNTTKSHNREIELDDETVRLLKKWRAVQLQHTKQDYIFSFFGDPMDKSTLSRTLKRHAEKAGVPIITGKGLRHSHDSFMINVLKMDVVEISNRSGRRDKATTLNTYSHYYQTGSDFNTKLTKAIGNVPHHSPHQSSKKIE